MFVNSFKQPGLHNFPSGLRTINPYISAWISETPPTFILELVASLIFVVLYHSVHKFTINNPNLCITALEIFNWKYWWQFIGSFGSAFGGLVLRVPHFVQPCKQQCFFFFFRSNLARLNDGSTSPSVVVARFQFFLTNMADRKPNPCIVKWILFTWYLNSPPFRRANTACESPAGDEKSTNVWLRYFGMNRIIDNWHRCIGVMWHKRNNYFAK